jgi:hypothetical protein
MNIKNLLITFVTVFAVTLIVSVVVTLLWNVIVNGANTIDWDTSIRFATVFGIIFSCLIQGLRVKSTGVYCVESKRCGESKGGQVLQ